MKRALLAFDSSPAKPAHGLDPNFVRSRPIINQLLQIANVTVILMTRADLNTYRQSLAKNFDSPIEVLDLSEAPNNYSATQGLNLDDYRPFVTRSLKLYEYLIQHDYDFAVLDVLGASGFIPIRAKKTSLGLKKTVLISWMRSCHEFEDRQAVRSPDDFDPFMTKEHMYFAEKYCCENSDLVFAHSKGILEWAIFNEWDIPGERLISVSQFLHHGKALMKSQDQICQGTLDQCHDRQSNYRPLVSICVAHFNDGLNLKRLLKSIERNDYDNFEVIVVDDGSKDEESREILKKVQSEYEPSAWRFFMKSENEGPGPTRNFAVEQASGELVIFMDSDNLSTPSMISDLVKGLLYSKSDCVSCAMILFKGESESPDKYEYSEIWFPLGQAQELAFYDNVVGDTNFCVRKSVFKALGGFSEAPDFLEDWDFLNKLFLAGFKLEVVPKGLYLYRDRDGVKRSSSWSGNSINSLRRRFLERTGIRNKKLVHKLLLREMAENERLRASLWKLDRKIVKFVLRLAELAHEEQRAKLMNMLNALKDSFYSNPISLRAMKSVGRIGSKLVNSITRIRGSREQSPTELRYEHQDDFSGPNGFRETGFKPPSTTKAQRHSVIRQRFDLPVEDPIFGFVGELEDTNRPLEFLRLAYWTRMLGDNAFFLMLGDGPLRETVQQTSITYGLNNFRLLTDSACLIDVCPILTGLVMTAPFQNIPHEIGHALGYGIPVLSTESPAVAKLVGLFGNGLVVRYEPEKKDFADCFLQWKSKIDVYRTAAIEATPFIDAFLKT